jgi:hypothetical protein
MCVQKVVAIESVLQIDKYNFFSLPFDCFSLNHIFEIRWQCIPQSWYNIFERAIKEFAFALWHFTKRFKLRHSCVVCVRTVSLLFVFMMILRQVRSDKYNVVGWFKGRDVFVIKIRYIYLSFFPLGRVTATIEPRCSG